MDIAGKTVVVTGGASGIGAGLAQRFATEGAAHVVVADIDEDGARAVAEEVGGVAVRCDVSQEPDVVSLVERAEREGPIDLFCSNAGIGIGGGVDVADDAWQRIWSINVMAHIYAARACVPRMATRGGGYLLQTASAAGLLTQLGSAPYAVTKHAAVALAEWMSIAYAQLGITVSVLCPQAVRTKMTAGGGSVAAVDGMLEPSDVADEVVRGLRDERFLILPHPQVAEYVKRKADDHDRWLRGMRRLQERFEGVADAALGSLASLRR